MIEDITFEEWLSSQEDVIEVNKLAYKIQYNNIPCAVFVTLYPMNITAAIRPLKSINDIGAGCGMSIYKTFPYFAERIKY